MKIDISKANTIWEAATIACKKAKEIKDYVVFEFNGTKIQCHWESWPDDICYIYNLIGKIKELSPKAFE